MGNSSTHQFGSRSTADDVMGSIDMRGKVVIVTGANSGIGLETARVLAKNGAMVIMGCRNLERSRPSWERVCLTATSPDNVRLMHLDLGSFRSILRFCEEFKRMEVPLNILVNNAGVASNNRMVTEDGLESMFGINHIGHFLLTLQLIPSLERGSPSRIVNVSSDAHKWGGVRWNDLMLEKSFSFFRGYSQSKSSNILFTVELQKRFSDRGISSNAVHPGYVPRTSLGDVHSRAPKLIVDLYLFIGDFIGRSNSQGAATQVYCATAPELEARGGEYYTDVHVAQCSLHARHPSEAERLWETSLDICARVYRHHNIPFDEVITDR